VDEPSLLFDLNSEISWCEELPDEEDSWITEIPPEMQEKVSSDAGTYDAESTSSDDFTGLLTEEEQAKFAGNSQYSNSQDSRDDLLSALMDDDEEGEIIGGNEEPTLLATSDEELMANLSEDVESAQLAPYADAGEEQMLVAEDGEVTTALLDGSTTFNPHERVVEWAWRDDRGRVIGTQSKIRVKLPLGRHRFELSVLDDEGVWTTDTTFIIVE
jgi:hypothetical protein